MTEKRVSLKQEIQSIIDNTVYKSMVEKSSITDYILQLIGKRIDEKMDNIKTCQCGQSHVGLIYEFKLFKEDLLE